MQGRKRAQEGILLVVNLYNLAVLIMGALVAHLLTMDVRQPPTSGHFYKRLFHTFILVLWGALMAAAFFESR